MSDYEAVIPTYEGEEHVYAALYHILKALGTSKNLNVDKREMLTDLATHLSTMTTLTQTKVERTRDVEEELNIAQKKVMRWESIQSKIWDSGSEEATGYLKAVYEIHALTESLASSLTSRNSKQKELLDQAHGVLQMAMERLESELIHILTKYKQPFESGNVSIRSHEVVVVSEESEGDSSLDDSRRNSNSTEAEEHVHHLIHPDAASEIKSIANAMIACHYDVEFCHVFVNFWNDLLNEYLSVLGFDTLSIDHLVKMEYECLARKIKKWVYAMKTILRVYLVSGKWLFHQVLGEFGSICSTSFIEASKGAVLSLVNFGEAIAIGACRPDKLFTLLLMYEAMVDLVADVDASFSEEVGSFVQTEFQELLKRLGESARTTFTRFRDVIASETSTTPFPGGGVHHITKYVMNYINLSVEYADTLNLLLGAQGGDELVPFGSVARHLRSLTTALERNLETKSLLYKDESLKHVFMMNNIHYMVQKVKGSDILGDDWLKEYTGKFQYQATTYERVTWCPIFSLLKSDGDLRRGVLQERYRRFNAAFEEIYKNQTGWAIPHHELRKDLRISISQKVVPAYRHFANKTSNTVGNKYAKHSADHVEDSILDLFEGSQR